MQRVGGTSTSASSQEPYTASAKPPCHGAARLFTLSSDTIGIVVLEDSASEHAGRLLLEGATNAPNKTCAARELLVQ